MESCGIERGSTHQQWAWFSHKGTAPSLAGPQHTCFWCKLARLCATVSWLEQWDLCWEPRKSCGRPSRGTGEQLPAGGTKESSRAVSKNPNVRGAKCCLEKGLELKVVCLVTVRTYKKCFSFKKWKKKKKKKADILQKPTSSQGHRPDMHALVALEGGLLLHTAANAHYSK